MIKELWQIINPFIRVLLMNTVTLCIFLEITGLLTGKKKTWRFFYGYIFIRAFVIRFLVDGIWRHYYLHETWWKLLLFILMVLNGFLLYLLCLFIFQGSPLKVAISAWSGEVLASAIMLCANTIINSLEGRPLNAMIYLPLQPLDLLAAPL